jgi:signal transduction histidine kinase
MSPVDNDCRQLLSLIAHELRSPGAVVAGYLRLLLRNPSSLPDPERKMIEDANRSCARLLEVVRELGDLADLGGTASLQPFSPVPIFELCDEVVQAAVRAGGAVTFSCADTDRPAVVEGHARRLRQVVGALVAVNQRERGARPFEACGFISREGGPSHAIIAFGDPGIAARPEDLLAHRHAAFDRWLGGVGLSLPIAHHIIEAHRGVLWALPGDSRATCALSLPLIPSA